MATAPKAAPKAGAADAAPAGKSKMVLMIAIGAIVVVAASGAGAWFFLGRSAEPATAGAARQAPAKPPTFMALETFTVNLQPDDGMQQFLQVNLTLQIGDQAADAIKLHMPQVRNRLLLLLSSKKSSEILSVEGKQKLASQIIAQMKLPFTPQGPSQEIADVFFTSFVVQ